MSLTTGMMTTMSSKNSTDMKAWKLKHGLLKPKKIPWDDILNTSDMESWLKAYGFLFIETKPPKKDEEEKLDEDDDDPED